MLISIVTCTWNSDRYLDDTISSVLKQKYQNYEFIFVDGGSTDNTLDIISKVPGNKIVLNDIGGGIANAMNEGIKAATGDIIIHLHSDDYLLHPYVFSKVVKLFEEQPNAQWLFGRILNDREGSLYPETYISPAYSFKNLLKSNIVPHAATFVKRQVFEKHGFFRKNLKYAMDYEMWLRIGSQENGVMVREAFSVFRRHDGSTTEMNQLASFNEDYKVRCEYLKPYSFAYLEHFIRYRIRRYQRFGK